MTTENFAAELNQMHPKMEPIPIVDGQNLQVSAACQHINNCHVGKHVAGW